MRRLAIGLLGLGLVSGAAALVGAPQPGPRPRRARGAGGRRDRGDRPGRRDRGRRRRRAHRRAAERSGVAGRGAPDEHAGRDGVHARRWPSWPSGSTTRGPRGHLGRAERRPCPRARRRSSSAPPPVTGDGAGTRLGDLGDPLPVEGFELDFGERHQPAAIVDARVRRRPGPRRAEARRRRPRDADPGRLRRRPRRVQYQGRTLDTAEVVQQGDQLRRQTIAQARFSKLRPPAPPHAHRGQPRGGLPAADHRACRLLVFELFTAGVGVAGVVGRALPRARLLRACWPCPTGRGRWPCSSPSIVCFAVDVQTGVPRFWTVDRRLSPSRWPRGSSTPTTGMGWLTLAVGIAGVLLAFLVGMPSMVRARFATPTIGRDWMVGELGEAVVAVDPEGVVEMRRRAVAGPHQPGHAHRQGRTGARRGHRRRHARGGARAGRGEGLPGAGARAATGAVATPTTTRSRPPPRRAPHVTARHALGVSAGHPASDGCQGQRTVVSSASGRGGSRVSTVRSEEAWQHRAACRGPQSSVFFPPAQFERKEDKWPASSGPRPSASTARSSTPAWTTPSTIREPHGIWGGLNEVERKQLLAQQGG